MVQTSIGRFRFDDATGALSGEGGPIDLGRRGSALLARLLERRGEVASKQDLIDAAWPDMAIEESNLSVQIARLRKLLGSETIETIGRIGYRLALDVSTAREARPLVGVPRFAGHDAGGEAMAQGITDDVTIGLARFGSLTVSTAETSDYVLCGSVRADARRLRVAVQLRAPDGRVLWGERFDGGPARGNAAVDGLIDRLVSQTEWEVQRQEIERIRGGRRSESAYDLYLRGRARLMVGLPEDNAAAIALFEQALAIEPNNVTIMAAVCDARAVRMSLGWSVPGADDGRRCRELATAGLALRMADATQTSMFGYGLYRAGERDNGLSVIARATAANSNSMYAFLLAGTTAMHWGRIEVAERQFRHAARLAPSDPNQAPVLGGLSRIRMMQGRYTDALSWAERALQVNQNYSGAQWTRVAANAKLGQLDAAHEHLDQFRRAQPNVTLASIRRAQPTREGRMAATLEGLALAGLPAE